MKKIKILITNLDVHGVNFYRSEQPAIMLSKLFDNEFDVDYLKNIDWNDLEFLKQYDIIHSHRTFCDYKDMPTLVPKLRELGITTILDIDDYWEVSKEHPLYHAVVKDNLKEKITANLKLVDYVSTTTPVYAEYIKEFNKNVFVIENGINTELKEFKYDDNKCTKDKLRLLYLAGSSHMQDVSLLKDSFERLVSDPDLKNKFQVNLSGFDLRGTTTNYKINDNFVQELRDKNLFTPELHRALIKYNFDIHKFNSLDGSTKHPFSSIPSEIKNKYPNGVLLEETRPIKPEETVWTKYEEIFTNKYKLIEDSEYLEFLKKYDLDSVYPNIEEQSYIRHKTRGLYTFGENYKHGDIAFAPIKVYGKIKNDKFEDTSDNRYQFAKSNLKIIEAAFHKVPVIASDVPIYNYDRDWVDGYNIIFINPERQYKDWYKKIKYCIKNPDYVKELGENAYQTALKKYELKVLTEKRALIYKDIIKNKITL